MNYQSQIKTAIDLISISIRTAPKSGGQDDVVFLSASNKQKNKIAQKMIQIGREKSKGKLNKAVREAIKTSWVSDANTVKNSQALILIGVRGKKSFGSNCTGCGFKNCAEFYAHNFKNRQNSVLGPFCMFKIWDLGIATDSAAKTASLLNVDNRIMYRIGIAVLQLRLMHSKKDKNIPSQIAPILGLPLSISGKNIYFDRLDKLQAAKILMDHFKAKK
ncbi:MAG: DUF2148 domain-containing protein [Candidatus Omnitrophota bacterium]